MKIAPKWTQLDVSLHRELLAAHTQRLKEMWSPPLTPERHRQIRHQLAKNIDLIDLFSGVNQQKTTANKKRCCVDFSSGIYGIFSHSTIGIQTLYKCHTIQLLMVLDRSASDGHPMGWEIHWGMLHNYGTQNLKQKIVQTANSWTYDLSWEFLLFWWRKGKMILGLLLLHTIHRAYHEKMRFFFFFVIANNTRNPNNYAKMNWFHCLFCCCCYCLDKTKLLLKLCVFFLVV